MPILHKTKSGDAHPAVRILQSTIMQPTIAVSIQTNMPRSRGYKSMPHATDSANPISNRSRKQAVVNRRRLVTSAATTAAATATPTTVSTTATAAAATIFARLGLVYRQRTTALVLTIQSGDGSLRVIIGSHFNKTEAFASTRFTVFDNLSALHVAKRREHLL